MTTLIKDPNTGSFALPNSPTLKPIVGYSASGSPIYGGPGTLSDPSYQNLISTTSTNTNTTNNGYTLPQTQNSNPTTSFTSALVKMLKDAQARDTQGQAGLMKQSQGITGLGLNDATRNFKNPLLTPSSGTSLGLSAQNEFDPLLLSVANQQKLGTQNLSNITDLVKQTQDAYDNEQERIQRAEEKKQDAIEKAKDRAASAANKNSNFDTDARIREFASKFKSTTGKAKGELNGDNYVNPNEWMAARDLWQAYGGSDATFESNFKRYLNPLSYKLAGYKEDSSLSPGQQALLDWASK